MFTTTNPHYEQRLRASRRQDNHHLMVKLPLAPKNASPVPGLTSLYHNSDPGTYGDRSYPGNCGGNLIKDLLNYFQPESVFDPMTGSGTCRDVCLELGIPCHSTDLKKGFDATSWNSYKQLGNFDFIWAHPPYWRQKVYSQSPKDMSQAATLGDFLFGYRQFIENCSRVLNEGGKFAILMGDYQDRAEAFVPLCYFTKLLAFRTGLRQTCTDIVRFSFGASSSSKVYRSSFIPGLHDTCMIFEKQPSKFPPKR